MNIALAKACDVYLEDVPKLVHLEMYVCKSALFAYVITIKQTVTIVLNVWTDNINTQAHTHTDLNGCQGFMKKKGEQWRL